MIDFNLRAASLTIDRVVGAAREETLAGSTA
jgi:hypothetical protein